MEVKEDKVWEAAAHWRRLIPKVDEQKGLKIEDDQNPPSPSSCLLFSQVLAPSLFSNSHFFSQACNLLQLVLTTFSIQLQAAAGDSHDVLTLSVFGQNSSYRLGFS